MFSDTDSRKEVRGTELLVVLKTWAWRNTYQKPLKRQVANVFERLATSLGQSQLARVHEACDLESAYSNR